MKKRSLRMHATIASTLLLVFLIALSSFLTSNRINRIEEERAISTLYRESEEIAKQIEIQCANDQELLELFSTVASSFSDLRDPQLWNIFDSYEMNGMMNNIAILLPDGTVLRRGESEINANGKISFEEEVRHGTHISPRLRSLDNSANIIRHYVPIIRDGEAIAMFYGVVDLDTMPENLSISPYGGEASIYIIDAETGDFLLDTWHTGRDLQNFYVLGERPLAPGYDKESFERGLFSGETGHTVFRSNSQNVYLYYQYRPININSWRLALSVREDLVFANAIVVRNTLTFLMAAEAVYFIAYLIWMLYSVKKETVEKQSQVDALNNVYDIARLLFAAHENNDDISLALKRIAENTKSSTASLYVNGSDTAFLFSYPENRPSKYMANLKDYFKGEKKEFEATDITTLTALFPSARIEGLNALSAIKLEDANGEFCGILALENPKRRRNILALLRSVGISFSMLCQNIMTYSTMREQSELDSLTGLYNRNRYELDRPSFKEWYKESLASVYIDANGLHELNNTKGHESGDEMLCRIASAIERYLGKEHSYRIGGDEFISYIRDLSEDEVKKICKMLEDYLAEKDIFIAIGYSWSDDVNDLTAFTKEAEKRMYEEKREFYMHHEIHHRG